MFGWYTPDDNLLRNGKLPVMVNMPRTNHLERLQGIYKTGLAVNNPRRCTSTGRSLFVRRARTNPHFCHMSL